MKKSIDEDFETVASKIKRENEVKIILKLQIF
jgi:hypothetical protein